MKNTLLAALLALAAGSVSAQTPAKWRIEGFVKNETGEPLSGARVQTDDSTFVIADAAGFYQLRPTRRPTAVTALRLGYFQRRILLNPADFRGDTFRLDIVLMPQNTLLQEVDIAAKKVEVLAEEHFQTRIFDYDFFGENLILLLRARKKHFVRLVSASNSIIDELELPGRPTVLHRSCTGVFHLAGSAFAQELILREAELDTFPRHALSEFRSLVEPCVLGSKGYYFFRKMGRLNQSIRYWYYEPSGEVHLFAQITRDAGMREARSAIDSMQANVSTAIEPNLPPNWRGQPYDKDFEREMPWIKGDFSLEHLLAMANYNHQINHLGWLESLRMDSLYAPLLNMGDTLLLFDHEHNEVRRFDVGFSKTETLPINYHHAAGWQKKLLKDAATQKLYALFATEHGHVLKQLNIQTFAAEMAHHLPEVAHLSHNFKMKNGFLYFLGRADVNVPNTSLYKIDIR